MSRNFRVPASAIIAFCAAALLSACFNPYTQVNPSPSPSEEPSQPRGLLAVNITAIAPWLRESSTIASRAYLYATSVTVEVETSLGVAVIPPVTQTLSLSNGTGSSTGTLATIPNVLVGSNYTVSVSVMNSAYSAVNPVVAGSVSSVTIEEDLTTTVDIVCTPSSPVTITANVSQMATLDVQDEAWYRLNALAGQLYTINPPTPAGARLFVFDSTGEFLADASAAAYEVTPVAAASYYIGVASEAAAITPTILVSAVFPPKNEGSVAAPVGLILETPHTFVLGISANSEQYSYYTFTTGADAGTYYLIIDSGTIFASANLYTDAGFSSLFLSSSSFSNDVSFAGLAASTTYYLRLQNNYSSTNTSTIGRIVSPSTAAAASRNEGSVASPIALTIGTPRDCVVGTEAYDWRSYYSFVAGSDPLHNVTLGTFSGGVSEVSVRIYSDAAFTSLYSGFSYINSSEVCTVTGLTGGSTYYLALTWSYGSGTDQPIVPLTIVNATPTCTPLVVADTYTPGELSASAPEIWYIVTVDPSTPYEIGWDDNFDGSPASTGDLQVSAYDESFGSYFTNVDSGYTTPRNITTSAGQTTLYIKVMPFGGSAGYYGTFGIRCSTPSTGSLIVNIR